MAQVKIGSNFQKVWNKEKYRRQNKSNRNDKHDIVIEIRRIPHLDLIGRDGYLHSILQF